MGRYWMRRGWAQEEAEGDVVGLVDPEMEVRLAEEARIDEMLSPLLLMTMMMVMLMIDERKEMRWKTPGDDGG